MCTNSQVVIHLLTLKFGPALDRRPSREELKMAERIASILKDFEELQLEIDEEERLKVMEEDEDDWNPEEEHDDVDRQVVEDGTITFSGGAQVSKERQPAKDCQEQPRHINGHPSKPDSEEIKIAPRPRKRKPHHSKKRSSKGRVEVSVIVKGSTSGEFQSDYRLISPLSDPTMSSILRIEEEIANEIERYARKSRLLNRKKPQEDGVFHYETYNEVLRLHDPDVLPTTPQSLTKKTLQPLLERLLDAPIVEELDETFSYEDLTVMRRPDDTNYVSFIGLDQQSDNSTGVL